MNDCSNAEMRDRLPDLLHERLDAAARAEVVAHVAHCADCTAELALLRDLRGVLVASPRLNVQRIVRALPSPAAVQASRLPARSRWMDWRVAASIAALAVGGASVGTYVRMGDQTSNAAAIDAHALPAARPLVTAQSGPTTAAAATATPVHELSTGEPLNDMTDRQLQSLLDDIRSIQPLPAAEPDSTIVTAADVSDTGAN